ncbi:glycoside hydrolase family 3 C-terminal domain-containing protein [Streptomyces sp. NPDC002896]|uniref:glycoside hydrolase family 3 protein n=1 Tax=Streptomyces sp. NPDC002896 TaxID=3154438 RepID=UPI003317CD1D
MSTASVPADLPSGPLADRLPFRDPGCPLAERVEDLLSRLTPAERIAMLHQYAPAVPRLGVAAFRTGTEALHGVAWLGAATVFPQPVGLGATWDEELVHQVATATSVELRAFHHHRRPATGDGLVSLQAWAPVVNLLRDPRWGRNEEGYAEDPLLTGRLAEAFCRGMAGDDPEFLRTAPVLKHFLAYNNEDDRCITSSSVRPRVLQEYDLAAFRLPVATGAATGVMAAYNLVNGRPCHVSPLLERELRRWAAPTGHELFVVSDADAPSNLVDPEDYFEDHAVSHAAALKAGIDSFTDHFEDSATPIGRITEARDRGLLTDADIDRAVRRQLALRFRLGEFDPERDPYAGTGWEVVDSPAHRALARRAATEAVVLLRNNSGLLPLAGTGRLAVVGPLADSLFQDLYSGTMPYRVTAAAGLTDAVAGRGGAVTTVEGVDRVVLRPTSTGGLLTAADDTGLLSVTPITAADEAAGFDLFDWDLGVLTLRSARTCRYVHLNEEDQSLTADRIQPAEWFVREAFRLEPAGDGTELLRSALTGRYAAVDRATGAVTVTAEDPASAERFTRTVVRDGIAEAVAAAGDAEAVVVVLGNAPHINGRETQDRVGLALPPAQERLLRAVVAARPETVLVVMSSYPYAVDWADENAAAVVWTAHGGQETGHALASVLLGDAEPAGRLPQTWYRAGDELPGRLDYDIIKAGWTYQYHRERPLYPFGHGLSYTRFDHTGLRLSTRRTTPDGSVTASVTVTNTGSRRGKETVQLYVRALGARYEAPLLKLAGFRKVSLDPGASRDVEFTLDVSEALAHWSVAEEALTVDPGEYEVLVARSASDVVLSAPLTVSGPEPAPRTAVGRLLPAAGFDDYTGIVLVDATRTDGDAVTSTAAEVPGTLVYRWVDLTGARCVTAEVSRTAPGKGRLEVWAGAVGADGTLLADLPVPSTGDRYSWTTASADLAAHLPGVHDLYLVLTGELRLAAFGFTA